MTRLFHRRTAGVGLAISLLAGFSASLGAGLAVAGQLVLDFGETGSIACGDSFVLAGLNCRTEPLSSTPCYADDFHGALLLSWAALVVDVGELSQISHVEAMVETHIEPPGSTVLAVYAGDLPVTYVVGSVTSSPELLELNTAGLSFDSIRLSGLTLTVEEMRIDSPVPAGLVTWSAVKDLYR